MGKREVLEKARVSEDERLQELNQQTRARRNPSDALRRTMEAKLDEKSRKRRRQQPSASLGWKPRI